MAPAIEIKNLTYEFSDARMGIANASCSLPSGSRTLLIGANGAGKTTLLRLLAGKKMAPASTISINGVDPFTHGLEGVTYLGLEWVLNSIVRTDIDVSTLLSSVGGDVFTDRRNELVKILDIDMSWRMHAVSDGERRRVQLAMGLIRPWNILLLDEITVDLDLLSRRNFLEFLKHEAIQRQCTIVYATHIFDNLAQWPSHIIHMHLGTIRQSGPIDSFAIDSAASNTGNSRLSERVIEWLQEDKESRGPRTGMAEQGKTYQDLNGLGGFGYLKHS